MENVSGELAAVIQDINQSLPERKLISLIERTNLSADMKALLADVAKITIKVGTKVLAIGRKILSFVLDLVRAFPTVTLGVLAALVITALIGAIPLFGGFLATALGSLLLALGIGAGALHDFLSPNLSERIDRLVHSMTGLAEV